MKESRREHGNPSINKSSISDVEEHLIQEDFDFP